MIVDGGLGIELERRGFVPTTGLWSGEAIIRRPQLLAAIHRAYLDAGAEIIETATYQLSHAALRRLGYDDIEIDGVFTRAVALARAAIVDFRQATGCSAPRLVAASLGPFGATVGDGSEYLPTQHLERDDLYRFHYERTRSVMRAEPDVYLFETIPTRSEAHVIAHVARDLELREVWLSLSCADGTTTYGGDDVAAIAAMLDGFECIAVIGVNCTAPAAIASLVRKMRSATNKELMVCPNVGQHWEHESSMLTGGTVESEIVTRIAEWLDLGVTHVGGCCGVAPRTIAEIAREVNVRRRSVPAVTPHTKHESADGRRLPRDRV